MKLWGAGLSLVIGLGIGAWMLNMMMSAPPTQAFGLAFGNPGSGTIEVHVGVPLMVAQKVELPKSITLSDGTPASQNEAEWLAEHYFLTDDAMGAKLTWRKMPRSPLIPMNTNAVYDHVLVATLTPGKSYTIAYKPYRDDPGEFTYHVTAPATPQEHKMVGFEMKK